ncbi:MAG: ABC transporter permease [Parasporobacterium sp.]|nr:ABC transporter permease [Parasporobacterium sp.]
MFLRMVRGTLFRQWKKMLMIAFTIALGASLCTAMLSVVLDVKDKVNQELKAYGANITVVPKQASILNDLYEVEGQSAGTVYLKEDELGNIKTIFWAFNIVDFAPFVNTEAILDDGSSVAVTGSWFHHHLSLPTGEELDAGMNSLRSWWDITAGEWIDEASMEETAVMIGDALAERTGLSAGDTIHLKGTEKEGNYWIAGVFNAGGDEDQQIFMQLNEAQALSGLDGCVNSIEVSALTTPDNELAVKAARDPSSLTIAQYETWYCTAYVSSICYQIQEVITDSVASAVRQVADSEGAILDKTQLLMILITILALVGSALGICNLVTASVMERSRELGLVKALGAYNRSVMSPVLTEILITAVVGGVAGFFAGIGFAQIIGHSVFNSSIAIRPMLIPIVTILVLLVTFAGCIPAFRTILKLEPTVVLHGG